MDLEVGVSANSPMPETGSSAMRFYLAPEPSFFSRSKRSLLAVCLVRSQRHDLDFLKAAVFRSSVPCCFHIAAPKK
jgi:hypothetical protein